MTKLATIEKYYKDLKDKESRLPKDEKRTELVYLASPYSHKDKHICTLRAMLVTLAGSRLIEKGMHIFGPITESSQYQNLGGTAGSWDFWEKHDKLMIDKCDRLLVLMIPGWKESTGVQAEIQYAYDKGMPVDYIRFSELCPEIKELLEDL